MALTQANLVTIHTLLVDYAWNALSGAPARKADLDALCLDIKTYCLDGKWDALDLNYRGVWLGEISRRLARIVPDATAVIRKRTAGDITQEKLLDTVAADGAQILRLKFSQFTINRHFQGHYEGQPDWLSGEEILDVAKTLRREPERSNDLRIRAHRHAGQWVALNNRGFALHCLANVVPARIAFDTELSSDEVERLGRSFADTGLNLGESIPASRRSRQDWDAMIPSSTTAVPETRNSTRVIYTIKAISMSPGAAPDNGNEQVMNSAL
jgi:hypothetical protein